ITEKMERASELERQLATCQTIVELDPVLIDASFVSDRLAIDAAELAQLVEQIREHGQQFPILVRPHPDADLSGGSQAPMAVSDL
ncbi:ParB N-terminal domain-containing protein, partial [Rhizobium leguminosarum]